MLTKVLGFTPGMLKVGWFSVRKVQRHQTLASPTPAGKVEGTPNVACEKQNTLNYFLAAEREGGFLKMRRGCNYIYTYKNNDSIYVSLLLGHSHWSKGQKLASDPIENSNNAFWDEFILKLRELYSLSSWMIKLG